MQPKTIAVLGGGYSSEQEVSRKSAKRVAEWLSEKPQYNVYLIDITPQGWYDKATQTAINKSDFSLTVGQQKITFDKVVIIIHGTPGENGILQAYFDLLNIPYTGCSSFVSALTFNKFACKSFLRGFGIEMAKSMLLRKNIDFDHQELVATLGLPIFIKPNNSGSSFGVTKVSSQSQIKEALQKGFAEDDELIAESFLKGREVTVGVYKLKNKIYTLPITEIVTDREYFDYQAKYEGKSQEVTPAPLEKSIETLVNESAKRIYSTLNCRGFVRIDFILEENRPYFLEVNTTPGMSESSIIPQQVAAAGLNISEFLSLIVEDND